MRFVYPAVIRRVSKEEYTGYFPDLTDCIYTISGYCRYLAVTAAPINKLHQSLGDDRLIIHQHNRIHHHISLSIGNASMICVPDPGWDRMVREA